MNDMEEFKPPINAIATETVFEQKFRERADVLYPGLMDRVEKQGPEYMAKLRNETEQNLPQTIRAVYEMNDKNFGMLSLSEEATSAFSAPDVKPEEDTAIAQSASSDTRRPIISSIHLTF